MVSQEIIKEKETLPALVAALLKVPDDGPMTMAPVKNGRNNRVYLFRAGREKYIVKHYYTGGSDGRDRLSAESGFASFLWERGVRNIAEPILFNKPHSIGIFRFINGKRLCPEALTRDHVYQAAGFIHTINEHRQHPLAEKIQAASEACFSLEQHIQAAGTRLGRLDGFTAVDDIDHLAKAFVKNRLQPGFEACQDLIFSAAPQLDWDLGSNRAKSDRMLSPSDFGFHNALVSKGKMFFHDFEYAGWDDGLKLICDFFCQPDVAVPLAYLEFFLETLDQGSSRYYSRPSYQSRIMLLIPLYRIKWCCIMLNEFIRSDRDRKRFASYGEDCRMTQLNKVKEYADRYRF